MQAHGAEQEGQCDRDQFGFALKRLGASGG